MNNKSVLRDAYYDGDRGRIARYGITTTEKFLNLLKFDCTLESIQTYLNKVLEKAEVLNFYTEYIRNRGAKGLAEALKFNATLHTLILNHNSIRCEGIKSLAEALKYNTTLRTLNLDYNAAGAEGAKSLAEALEYNTTLHALHLSFNYISKEGAKSFAEALKFNTTLHTLHLLIDDLWYKGEEDILKVLKLHNISIISLGPDLDQSEQFKAVLEQNKKIQSLMEELVKIHATLPEPIYDNIAEAVKARSVSLYNTRLLSVLCKDIYQNNSAAKISCCPPEIFYEIFTIYNEPKLQEFKTKYGGIPTVCRATLELAINQIKAEISR